MTAASARFLVTLVIGRRLFWEVDPAGIIEVPDVAAGAGPLICFDHHEHRLPASRPLSERRARERFMREWGERVRVVNQARELAAVYGRDPRHGPLLPSGRSLHSGLQLIDRLARVHGLAVKDRILGLRLGSADGHGRRLALLFAYDREGDLLRFQEAANPPSLEYLVEDFRRGLPAGVAAEPPHWFDQQAVVAVLPSLRPYPEDETLWSLPLPAWWCGVARAVWMLSAAALLWSAWAVWAVVGIDAESTQAQADSVRAERQLQEELPRHVQALARRASADLRQGFADAEQLWRPGARIRLLATPGALDYALLLVQPGGTGTTPSGSAPLPDGSWRLALDTLAQHPPAGLSILAPALSGDLHACYIRFRRQTALPALAAVPAAEP